MSKALQIADAASAAAFSNPFSVVTIRTLRPNVCTDCISYKEKITLDKSSTLANATKVDYSKHYPRGRQGLHLNNADKFSNT